MAEHEFEKRELIKMLDNAVGKTLGDVDVKNVFYKTKKSPKITGIAGDVIEQSVLGYSADSSNKPDLIVDGEEVELKTTGIRRVKNKKSSHLFEAKEPMTITAVSPENITKEKFLCSVFWRKLRRTLIVLYHYDSEKTVPAAKYADFIIEDYIFHEFTPEETKILKEDWKMVRDFIRNLQNTYPEPEKYYPLISSALRKNLMMIDTAPKWPNRPRFRLKRSTVTNIVQKHFGNKLEMLDKEFTSYSELDKELHRLTKTYANKTIKEIIKELNIEVKSSKRDSLPKNISEQIVVAMFGGKSKKISQIDLFQKINLIPKTVTLSTNKKRKEDMKLFTIDFNEWTDENIEFEDSFVFSYFNSMQFLCIVFQNQGSETSVAQNKFLGFKRVALTDEIIYKDIKAVWEEVRNLINNNLLEERIIYKKDGSIKRTPKTNLPSVELNFPKSKNNLVFIRGTGKDSSYKPLCINGINMYHQSLWIRGSDVAEWLKGMTYI